MKKVWVYIHKHNLQDSNDGRNFHNDANMKAVFGRSTMSASDLMKFIGKHIQRVDGVSSSRGSTRGSTRGRGSGRSSRKGRKMRGGSDDDDEDDYDDDE